MLVGPGNPPGRHTPRPAPDRACVRDRLVRVATSASGSGASLTSQAKAATVVLGRVCKGVKPDEDGADVKHGEVVGGTFLVAGRDAPDLLQAVEQALHPVARSISLSVETGTATLVRLGRDHGGDAPAPQVLPRGAARKGLVAHHASGPKARTTPLAADRAGIEQRRTSDVVVALAPGQVEGDRLAASLSPDVDLGREASTRAA